MAAKKRRTRKGPTATSRKRALREILTRMEKDPEGVIAELREWVEREEQKAAAAEAEWQRMRKEHGWPEKPTDPADLLREILRETSEKPENVVRLVGICGRVIFEKLERWGRTK